MLDFYRTTPAGCIVEANGDMLLFQWGTYDWGQGLAFEVTITRQLIDAGAVDDDAISQLHLTFEYAPPSAFGALGSGNIWCKDRCGLAEFSALLFDHDAVKAVRDVAPTRVSVKHDWV